MPKRARDTTVQLTREEEERIAGREMEPIDNLILLEMYDGWVTHFDSGRRSWSATENAARPCWNCQGKPKPRGHYCGVCDTPKGSGARAVRRPKPVKTNAPLKVKVATRKEKRAAKRREAA